MQCFQSRCCNKGFVVICVYDVAERRMLICLYLGKLRQFCSLIRLGDGD